MSAGMALEAAEPSNTWAYAIFVDRKDSLEFLGLRVVKIGYILRDRKYLCGVQVGLRNSEAQWQDIKSFLVRTWGTPVSESGRRFGMVTWKSASGETLAALDTTSTLHADGRVTHPAHIEFNSHVSDKRNACYGGIP